MDGEIRRANRTAKGSEGVAGARTARGEPQRERTGPSKTARDRADRRQAPAGYVLRAFQLLIDSFGDVRAGLLAQAIHTANVAYLDARTERGQRAAGSDGIIPDELRRPISIARLADSAGLPFEYAADRATAERYGGLRARRCRWRDRPEGGRGAAQNGARRDREHRLRPPTVRDLQAAGLAEADPLAGPQAAERTDADGAVRIVARLSAEYILRARWGSWSIATATYVPGSSRRPSSPPIPLTSTPGQARVGATRHHPAPPDEVRKPISIARLAASLGVPYETMRGAGSAASRQRGLHPRRRRRDRAGGGLERPEMAHVMLANVRYVRRLVRDLCAVEFASGSRRGPSDAPTPELGHPRGGLQPDLGPVRR